MLTQTTTTTQPGGRLQQLCADGRGGTETEPVAAAKATKIRIIQRLQPPADPKDAAMSRHRNLIRLDTRHGRALCLAK